MKAKDDRIRELEAILDKMEEGDREQVQQARQEVQQAEFKLAAARRENEDLRIYQANLAKMTEAVKEHRDDEVVDLRARVDAMMRKFTVGSQVEGQVVR